jgi:hypothetical protein
VEIIERRSSPTYSSSSSIGLHYNSLTLTIDFDKGAEYLHAGKLIEFKDWFGQVVRNRNKPSMFTYVINEIGKQKRTHNIANLIDFVWTLMVEECKIPPNYVSYQRDCIGDSIATL